MNAGLPRILITQPFVNFCTMQVCAEADATDAEILAACNERSESGTASGWAEVIRETDGTLFKEANKAPVQCSEHPNRTHFLVLC